MDPVKSIRSSREFHRVLREGRRVVTGPIAVYALRSFDPGRPARLGLAVRVPGRAVLRNRLKRRLREAFRACSVAPGHQVVIRADGRLASLSYQKLVEDLDAALRRATAS